MKIRTVTEYICETCGGVYDNEADATNCEGSHKFIVGRKEPAYHAFTSYPENLQIDFSDGTRQTYKRMPQGVRIEEEE